MDLFIKYFGHLSKVITWLNLRKVFLLAFAGLVVLVMFTAYEQRSVIVKAIADDHTQHTQMKTFKVSTEMEDKIRALVNSNPLVKSVVVFTADLRLNERDIVFRFSDDPYVSAAWQKQFAEHGTVQPIFTKDDANNAQMVSVINGEFSCHKYETTINQVLLPGLAKQTPMICRISLPPYYGEFSGYLSVVLGKTPSESERKELEIEIKRLANEIFFKNIVARG